MNKGGAPKGNNNAGKGRRATQALNRALDIRSQKAERPLAEDYCVLVDMWDVQIGKALEGDNGSMTMIVERLEGKPKQAIVGGDEDDAPLRIARIELVALDDDSSD